MISSLKIKLNRSWNFQRNWNVSLVLLERSWWAGLNGIYLVRFGFRVLEILIFKMIYGLENSNKFQKTTIWKEKPGNIWRLTIQFKAWFPFIFGCSKESIHTLQNNVTCWVSLFCNGFTVVAMKGDYLEFKKCERQNSRKTINHDKDQHENFFWEPPRGLFWSFEIKGSKLHFLFHLKFKSNLGDLKILIPKDKLFPKKLSSCRLSSPRPP